MAFEALRKRKAVEITLTLFNGTKGVREIHDAVEGSFSTISKRIEELMSASIVEEVCPRGMERLRRPLLRRVMKLTDEGRNLIDSLVQSGFLNMPPLRKQRQKWILSVLSTLGIVKGRTKFIKLLFLLKFKFGLQGRIPFKFRPWIYGPYSKDIIDDLKDLQKDGWISEKAESYRKSEFREETLRFSYALTPSGARLARELLAQMPYETVEKLRSLRPFNALSLNKLLEYVYYNYPNFITNSAIVERVLDSYAV